MNIDQITGPLRAIAPVLVAILIAWGVDSNTAGYIAAGIIALLSAAWSWWSNRPAQLAKALVGTPDVGVVVGSAAPPALKEVASDPAVPNVRLGP